MTTSFPPLRAAVLHGLVSLKEAFDADPTILDNSPYDGEAKAIISGLFAPKVVEKVVEKQVKVAGERGRPSKEVRLSSEDMELIKSEIKDMQKALNEMGTGEGLETNERIQIMKTKASLVEQLLKMGERTFNVKQMSEFQTVVIGILDDLVSEADRNVFLSRMDQYRD